MAARLIAHIDPSKISPFRSDTWEWAGAEEYKQERLAEYQRLLEERGIPADARKEFVAQLIEENGQLAETNHGDEGCSVGIPQKYVCDEGYTAKSYLKAFPEWQDWRYQMKWMADDAKGRWDKYKGNIRLAIIAHNCPDCANHGSDACWIKGVRQKQCYYQRVSDNLTLLTNP